MCLSPPRRNLGGMFVRYYVEIPLPPDQVESALLDAPAEWLSALAGEADQRGGGLLAEVGVGPLGPHLGRRVAVSVGPPLRYPSKTLLPFTWRPASGTGLLPDLDGDIELGPLGPGHTQLAISGRYRPPLGSLGRAADRVLLHRVAEATVKDFLDRVAAALARPPQPATT
ncbi:MAG TPA: SRPBCC family protein [Actinomycetes bacterium]